MGKGVLTSADKDILIDQGLSNELTRMFEWGDCGINANLVTIMEGYKDPRIALYITKNSSDIKSGDNVIVAEGTKYLGIRGGCNLPNQLLQCSMFLFNSVPGNESCRILFPACRRCFAWLEYGRQCKGFV